MRAVGWWGTWTLTLIILGLIAIAVADEMAIADPGDDATLGFTILTFGVPALFLLAQLVFLDQALGHNGPVAVVGTGGARGPRGRHRRHRPRERSHPTAGLFAARSAGCYVLTRGEQPDKPHRMTRGGTSCSSALRISVRPSVWSA